MDCIYQDYDIESFEAGKSLWHARIRRADLKPLLVDGALFPKADVGGAWSDRETAIADAKEQIDGAGDFRTEPAGDERDIEPFL